MIDCKDVTAETAAAHVAECRSCTLTAMVALDDELGAANQRAVSPQEFTRVMATLALGHEDEGDVRSLHTAVKRFNITWADVDAQRTK